MIQKDMARTIHEVFIEAVKSFRDGVDLGDFVLVTGLLMRIVQRRPDLKGSGTVKKEIVIGVFALLIEESRLFTTEQADDAAVFLADVLPTLVNVLKTIAVELADAIGDIATGEASVTCCGLIER